MKQYLFTAACLITGEQFGLLRLNVTPEGEIEYRGSFYEHEYQIEQDHNMILTFVDEEEV